MSNNMRLSGIISGMDTESLVKQLTARYTTKKDKIYKEKETLKYKQDAWKDLNKDVYKMFNKLSDLRLKSTYRNTEIVSSKPDVATISGQNIQGQHNIEIKQIATQTYLTGGEVEQNEPIGVSGRFTITIGGKEKEVDITANMSMKQVAQKLNDAGLIANFDEDNKRLFLASKSTGAESNFQICGDGSLLDAIGLGAAAIKQQGKDAIMSLNGVDFTSDTNVFKVNNMVITAQSEGSTIVGTKTNNKILDTIKSFIEEYNVLIKKIDKAYNSIAAKGYSPLTKDEKYELSDKEIEEWEDKLKEGALSKDESLSAIGNLFKSTMNLSFYNGLSLDKIGISLGGYFNTEQNDRNAYNIDEEKLIKAINEDSDAVVNFITKLSTDLYDKLNLKMKSSTLNSMYTAYNDKQLKEKISNYEKQIAQQEAKIIKMEDKYYTQFAKMEKLLSKSQSQTTYLSNYFGI